MKRFVISTALFSAYVIGAMLPLEWFWFDPGTPRFADTEVGGDPPLTYIREIKVVVALSYSVILRDMTTQDVVCDAAGGPFDYLPSKSGPLVGKTLSVWAPADDRCAHLPVGEYYGSVTWEAAYPLRAFLPDLLDGPLGWLIPPKSVTRQIAPFKITAKV